tara:strand:- start:468 stop:1283 length:816 start_codon:yes stop_codon:yes gene_type:complete
LKGVLLTSADLARWDEQIRAYRADIALLMAKVDQVQRQKALATELARMMSGEDVGPQASLASASPTRPEARGQANPKPRKLREGSWPAVIRDWVYAATSGLSPVEMRSMIEADDKLQARFSESEKGYYHGLSRLQRSGTIIRHKGRYYSPSTFADFQKRVAAGEVEDEPVQTFGHSPMGEAILDIVASTPGIKGSEIIRELRTDAEFDATLTPHTTGAYNVISRLARRNMILRDGQQCFVGPEMPPRDPASKWIARHSRDGMIAEHQGGLI